MATMTVTAARSWTERVIAFKRSVPGHDATWHTLGACTDRRPAADRLFALRLAFRGEGLAFRAYRQWGGTRIEIQVRWGEGITSATAFGDQGADPCPSPRGGTHGAGPGD